MDKYRVFISRPTGENGDPEPVESSNPSYFRVKDSALALHDLWVEFWDGTEWEPSVIQPFSSHLDDVLGSGATVREILDDAELPDPVAMRS